MESWYLTTNSTFEYAFFGTGGNPKGRALELTTRISLAF